MVSLRCSFGLALFVSAACVVVRHEEPWAPLQLTLDDHVVSAHADAFVYVDDVYRGNFLAGNFMLYLTLEPHEVRVSVPGFDEWTETVTMSRQEYPAGKTVVVTPTRPKSGA